MWLSYHDFVAISAAVAAREGKEWGLTYKQWALVKSSLQVMGIIATAGQRGELFCHQTWRTVIHAVEAAPEPFLMIGPDPIPTMSLPKMPEKVDRQQNARVPSNIVLCMRVYALLTGSKTAVFKPEVVRTMAPDELCKLFITVMME